MKLKCSRLKAQEGVYRTVLQSVVQKKFNGFKCEQCKFTSINSDNLMNHLRICMNRNTPEEETRGTEAELSYNLLGYLIIDT